MIIFTGTDLEPWLREQGIDTITLVGYMTNNCVIASAAAAEPLGFAVEVLSDATGAIGLANEAGTAPARQVHETLMALLHSNWAAVADARRGLRRCGRVCRWPRAIWSPPLPRGEAARRDPWAHVRRRLLHGVWGRRRRWLRLGNEEDLRMVTAAWQQSPAASDPAKSEETIGEAHSVAEQLPALLSLIQQGDARSAWSDAMSQWMDAGAGAEHNEENQEKPAAEEDDDERP